MPDIQVGILISNNVTFKLEGNFKLNGHLISGIFSASVNNQLIRLEHEAELFDEESFVLESENSQTEFVVYDVVIGINFHWEQKENQRFKGSVKLVQENGKVRLINIISLEEYLCSVISSEMSVTSSPEFLKAHTIISRSWLLAQIRKRKQVTRHTHEIIENELIRWYDREDHIFFDVCADDHCQRYQGITKIINEKAFQAVQATHGQVLIYNGEICDTRFSKCCGGISENFENVWEPVSYPYLSSVRDHREASDIKDLRVESEAEKWIRSAPAAFCHTNDKAVLSQVLPDFDRATADFYRWKVSYSQEELSSLILKKTGIDFGRIRCFEPVERGYSGRLIKLRIIGENKTLVVGKELEIRRALSPSHLYSSAFVVDYGNAEDGFPATFTFIGAGWGHGVGLCQIGAAMMGEKGYGYEQILNHYFKNSTLNQEY